MIVTRRMIRSLGQIGVVLAFAFTIVFLADTRYRLLPDALHSTLASHHVGTVITDITISYCSSANPFAKCRLDEEGWHRVEKDLYLHSGWVNTAWLHVQRTKEEDLTVEDKVVVAVRVSRLNPGASEESHGDGQWESRPGGIWILRSNKRHESDSDRVVTAVDVLFGADAVDPRPNWILARTPLLIDSAGSAPPAKLSVRHGAPVSRKKMTNPRINNSGKFKILQISDAHLSTGLGVCRDALSSDGASATCEADPRTLEFIESVLDDEKPDMVVLSGDQMEGPAAPDTQTALLKMVAPLIERSIPYATIFGNHDDEGERSLSREVQMKLLEALPFSLAEKGPVSVDGVGNYIVEVLAPSPSSHSAITIYLLDSHGLSPDEKNYEGYDWLKQSQIDWFRSTADSLKKSHNKYSHIHMDMAFIHIPLPEYADPQNMITGGQRKETVTAPGFNTHFYDALADEGIVAVGCGHDHVNDYCALRPQRVAQRDVSSSVGPEPHPDALGKKHKLGPWMCYAGGSGFGGYGGHGGFHRRVRVWDIDTNAGSMMTWKRVECCGPDTRNRIDEVILVESGNVVAPA